MRQKSIGHFTVRQRLPPTRTRLFLAFCTDGNDGNVELNEKRFTSPLPARNGL